MIRAAILVGLLAVLLAFVERSSSPATAQSPFPTGLMRSTVPPLSEPNDGADVLVVEGLAAGVGTGGCDVTTLDVVKFVTVAAINAGRKVVTQISPQSGCSDDLDDWKDMLDELVSFVVDNAPSSGTYWGGVMLDEEDDFWTSSDSVAAYVELNEFTSDLLAGTPGVSWYFTETFTGEDVWDQSDFNQITGDSYPAPQIATDYMVEMTNGLPTILYSQILVTWSLIEDYGVDFRSLYRASSRIGRAPLKMWGLDLSNCFTPTNLVLQCGPDEDDDGLIGGVEVLVGTNPFDKYTDLDTCTDGEETGISHIFGGERSPTYWADFFDTTADQSVDTSDGLDVLGYFGDPGTSAAGNFRDRYMPDEANKPWLSAEANDGIDLIDAITAMRQFGDSCTGPP